MQTCLNTLAIEKIIEKGYGPFGGQVGGQVGGHWVAILLNIFGRGINN